MNLYVGITDSDWFDLLSAQGSLSDVNFWQPGGNQSFKALQQGELFLFKPHKKNYIIGGGIFSYSTLLPVSLAWDAFGIANGATSLAEMRRRIEKYRKKSVLPHEDYTIGCVLLCQPFFFSEDSWIALPSDWNRHIVQGRRYDLTTEPGSSLYHTVISHSSFTEQEIKPRIMVAESSRYGTPKLIQPRLGQGSFRVIVTDAYRRRCAITGEKVLPVLEAAHIRPYAEGGEHRVDNGLLLRSDLHTLLDRGYITVSPDYHIEVSKRIREDYENGRDYYALHGSLLREPTSGMPRPSGDNLSWHNSNSYLG